MSKPRLIIRCWSRILQAQLIFLVVFLQELSLDPDLDFRKVFLI